MIYIGMDDTDMPDTRGTGHLARAIAGELGTCCDVRGVSRHQLLRDPRVPMTKNNSANVIHIVATDLPVAELAARVEDAVRREAIPGSDPGTCVLTQPSPDALAFGLQAKTQLVTMAEARKAAAACGAIARSLGGTGGGIIGAVAGTGLAAGGDDGRFVLVGSIRELADPATVEDVIAAGVDRVQTTDGRIVRRGTLIPSARIRPEIIDHKAVLLVDQTSAGPWTPVRRD